MAGETILVADDSEENRQFIAEYLLRSHGYVPLIATDGRQGLRMALDEKPDLMILDSRMPGLSGLEVLAALREQRADVPVIFITAYGSEEDIVASFRLGVKDYFRKPFNAQEMLDTIERVLGESQPEQQTRQRQELEGSIKELGTLYGSNVELVLNRIVESAVAITEAETGYLLLVDEVTRELYVRSALNVGERFAREFRQKIQDSIAGYVVRTGKPVRHNHLDDLDRFKVKTGFLVKSLINVPLRARDKVIGVLSVNNRFSSQTFSRTDMDLLTSLAEHAAVAIENANSYEQTHQTLARRMWELSAMQEVARDLNAVADVERIAELVLRHATRLTSSEAGLLGLLTDDGVKWVPCGYLLTAMRDGTWSPSWSEGAIGAVARSGKPVLIDDTHAMADRGPTLARTHAQLVVPILRGEQVIGVIDLENTKDTAFSTEDQHFLQGLADYAAIAMVNARLFDMIISEQGKTKFILRSIADGVYTVDCGLYILTFNPAAERITGWQEAEVRGRQCSTIFRDADNGDACHQVSLIEQALQSGQSVSSAADAPPILSRDGRKVFASSSVAPLRNREGQIGGAVVAFRDVSAERELDRLQMDFVSTVSHEFRSPLANISAAIELVQQSSQDHASQQTLDIALDSVEHLTRLVEDILNVSQIEAGQMRVQREPVTLLPLIRRAVRIAQARTDGHRVLIRAPDFVPFVMADRNKVEIVLNNLLSNAINYSPSGGRILVKVTGLANGEIQISVVDEGIGISRENIEKIFDRFYQVDASDKRKVYGHGLGLYISKYLIELQGGRIWAQSMEGRGACFNFTLPIVQEAEIVGEEGPPGM